MLLGGRLLLHREILRQPPLEIMRSLKPYNSVPQSGNRISLSFAAPDPERFSLHTESNPQRDDHVCHRLRNAEWFCPDGRRCAATPTVGSLWATHRWSILRWSSPVLLVVCGNCSAPPGSFR